MAFTMFESISRTKKKNRNKTVESPFVIPGVSNKQQINLRVKPIVESEIGFLLEFDRYSSN